MDPKTIQTLRKLIAVLPVNLKGGWLFRAWNVGGVYKQGYGLISSQPHTSLGIDIDCTNSFRQPFFWGDLPHVDDKKLGNALAAYVAEADPATVEQLLEEREMLQEALKLCIPILQTDVYELDDDCVCYYCGAVIDSGDEHKEDCKQIVAYRAARAAIHKSTH